MTLTVRVLPRGSSEAEGVRCTLAHAFSCISDVSPLSPVQDRSALPKLVDPNALAIHTVCGSNVPIFVAAKPDAHISVRIGSNPPHIGVTTDGRTVDYEVFASNMTHGFCDVRCIQPSHARVVMADVTDPQHEIVRLGNLAGVNSEGKLQFRPPDQSRVTGIVVIPEMTGTRKSAPTTSYCGFVVIDGSER